MINPLGRTSFYRFNRKNQLTHSWGDVPYPVEYRYNDYDELVMMLTFRDGNDWSQEIWPASAEGDKSSWHYQEGTGLLLSRRDAAGNEFKYSYNRSDRLKTRKDARGIVTTYNYSSMGELLGTDYSDETPDLSFAYDRIGENDSHR